MVKKGQCTGVFDLTDVDTINLNPIKSQEDKKKEPTVIMDNPQILVDATITKRDNGKILISHAMLIVKNS